MRKTAKKTQVETSVKIARANTEDLKFENHNKFKNQKLAEISANYRLLQERDVETDVGARVEGS
jgi:ABC-type lipoprotein export system ATPase subunit